MAEAVPDLFGDVRAEGREHDRQRLGHFARTGAVFGHERRERIVQFDEFCDRGIEAEVVHVGADTIDALVQRAANVVGCGLVRDTGFPGILVDNVAPHTLQEALHADDITGVPGATCFKRSHRHFVEAERIGAVLGVHIVGGDDVLQALAHLSVLAGDFFSVKEVFAVAIFDLVGGHGLATHVAVRVGLDVSLVEQAMERFLGRHVAEVVENLVPEARIEKVQHGVLDAADVKVDTAGVAGAFRAHPVTLDIFVDKSIRVGGVEVAQFVPTRARPLRHHVHLAAVGLDSIA